MYKWLRWIALALALTLALTLVSVAEAPRTAEAAGVTVPLRASIAMEGTAPTPAEQYGVRITAWEKDFPLPEAKLSIPEWGMRI